MSLQVDQINHFNDFIKHLIDFLVILLKFPHQVLLIVIHFPESFFLIIILVFLRPLGQFLLGVKDHLVLNVRTVHNFDSKFALFKGILIIEHVPQYVQVVINSLKPVLFVLQLLLLVLLSFLPQLRGESFVLSVAIIEQLFN